MTKREFGRFRVLPALVLILASCAAPKTASTTIEPSALRQEVEALTRAMVAAFDSEPASVARFYADDARIVGPRRQTVSGRAAIDRYWAGISRPATWTLEVVDVGGSRESAHQIGVSRLSSARSDGSTGTYVCDFVVIWRRQPDGTLRIVLDLYN
jgi:ketosteroid isomerase-like protein